MLDRKEYKYIECKYIYLLLSIHGCTIHSNIETARELLDESLELIRCVIVNLNDVTVVDCLSITREVVPKSRMALQKGSLHVVIKKASRWLATGKDGLDFSNDDLVCFSLSHGRTKVPNMSDGSLMFRRLLSLGSKCRSRCQRRS